MRLVALKELARTHDGRFGIFNKAVSTLTLVVSVANSFKTCSEQNMYICFVKSHSIFARPDCLKLLAEMFARRLAEYSAE